MSHSLNSFSSELSAFNSHPIKIRVFCWLRIFLFKSFVFYWNLEITLKSFQTYKHCLEVHLHEDASYYRGERLMKLFQAKTVNFKIDTCCKWNRCFRSWVGDCGKRNKKKLSSLESSTIKIFLKLVKWKWVDMLQYMVSRLLLTFLTKSIHKYTLVKTSINKWKKKRINWAKHHLKGKVARIC